MWEYYTDVPARCDQGSSTCTSNRQQGTCPYPTVRAAEESVEGCCRSCFRSADQKSRRKAGCDVGGQTGTLKDKWDPYFSLASSNLVYKHKAGTLYHRPGHMLCSGPRVAEGEELAGAGGAVGPHQQGKPADG